MYPHVLFQPDSLNLSPKPCVIKKKNAKLMTFPPLFGILVSIPLRLSWLCCLNINEIRFLNNSLVPIFIFIIIISIARSLARSLTHRPAAVPCAQ